MPETAPYHGETSRTSDIGKILYHAAQIIETSGWTKHNDDGTRPTGPRTPLTAIAEAVGMEFDPDKDWRDFSLVRQVQILFHTAKPKTAMEYLLYAIVTNFPGFDPSPKISAYTSICVWNLGVCEGKYRAIEILKSAADCADRFEAVVDELHRTHAAERIES